MQTKMSSVIKKDFLHLKIGRKWKSRFITLQQIRNNAGVYMMTAYKEDATSDRRGLFMNDFCGLDVHTKTDGDLYVLSVFTATGPVQIGFLTQEKREEWRCLLATLYGEELRYDVSVPEKQRLKPGHAVLRIYCTFFSVTRGRNNKCLGRWFIKNVLTCSLVHQGLTLDIRGERGNLRYCFQTKQAVEVAQAFGSAFHRSFPISPQIPVTNDADVPPLVSPPVIDDGPGFFRRCWKRMSQGFNRSRVRRLDNLNNDLSHGHSEFSLSSSQVLSNSGGASNSRYTVLPLPASHTSTASQGSSIVDQIKEAEGSTLPQNVIAQRRATDSMFFKHQSMNLLTSASVSACENGRSSRSGDTSLSDVFEDPVTLDVALASVSGSDVKVQTSQQGGMHSVDRSLQRTNRLPRELDLSTDSSQELLLGIRKLSQKTCATDNNDDCHPHTLCERRNVEKSKTSDFCMETLIPSAGHPPIPVCDAVATSVLNCPRLTDLETVNGLPQLFARSHALSSSSSSSSSSSAVQDYHLPQFKPALCLPVNQGSDQGQSNSVLLVQTTRLSTTSKTHRQPSEISADTSGTSSLRCELSRSEVGSSVSSSGNGWSKYDDNDSEVYHNLDHQPSGYHQVGVRTSSSSQHQYVNVPSCTQAVHHPSNFLHYTKVDAMKPESPPCSAAAAAVSPIPTVMVRTKKSDYTMIDEAATDVLRRATESHALLRKESDNKLKQRRS